MTTESNCHAGKYYTPAGTMKTLQEGQPLPTAGSSQESAADPVVQNPPFGAHSKNAE